MGSSESSRRLAGGVWRPACRRGKGWGTRRERQGRRILEGGGGWRPGFSKDGPGAGILCRQRKKSLEVWTHVLSEERSQGRDFSVLDDWEPGSRFLNPQRGRGCGLGLLGSHYEPLSLPQTMSPEEWTYLVVLLISIPIGFLFKKAGESGSLPRGK